MEESKMQEIAQYLYDAEKNKTAIDNVTEVFNISFDEQEAYDIQDLVVALKKETDGKTAAYKIGLTSPAKIKQLNIDQPVYAHIFEYMISYDGEPLSMERFIHPRIEPEVTIVLKEDIYQENVTFEEVMDKIDYVYSSVEIVDSRYHGFRFSLEDVVADNTSCQGAVYSNTHFSLDQVDILNEKAVVYINGEKIDEGIGKDVANHPANAVVFLANALYKRGVTLEAGVPIMTGGMTKANKIEIGDKVEVKFDTMDDISFEVVE